VPNERGFSDLFIVTFDGMGDEVGNSSIEDACIDT
jgi:hypothetical protein